MIRLAGIRRKKLKAKKEMIPLAKSFFNRFINILLCFK